ncbi:MAG: nucleotide exchange factor GrpE [Planctomycetota bacterium]|nr:MAG: nucleotide exchange factor GrpE [Planctomycetota bacterium]
MTHDASNPNSATDDQHEHEPIHAADNHEEAAAEIDDDQHDELAEQLAESMAANEEQGAEAEAPLDAFALLRQENQGLKEQLLRERADFDNIRKRLRREAAEAGNRAIARFARPLLLQMDNFGHALEAANPDAFMDFAMGVTMIRDGLLSALNEGGIAPIESQGPFNPAHHEVVAEIPSDLPKGHIVAVQRAGFKLGEQLVRAAQVVVSAGQDAEKDAPVDTTNDIDETA